MKIKTFIKKLGGCAILIMILLPVIALARTADKKSSTDSKINEIFQIPEEDAFESLDTQYVKNIPKAEDEVNYTDVYSSITRFLLAAATILTFVGIFISGVLFVTAQGEESKITKAKQVLMYILIGVAIIAVAYAVTIGITRIKPF